jgi:hypothetical protein
MVSMWGRFPRWSAVLALLFLTGCASARTGREISTAAAAVAFAHGVLAFHEGKYEEAAELFAAAVRYDPRDATARQWLALARSPAIVAPEGLLATVLPAAALPRWEGRVGFDAGRDSNPGLFPEDLPATSFGLSKAKADEEARLDGRVEVHLFYDRRGWTLGLAAAGSHSMHREQTSLDLSDAHALASLAWGRDPRGYLAGPQGYTRVPKGTGRFSFLLQAAAAETWIGGDSFLQTITGAATLLGHTSDRTATRLDLEASDRRYPSHGRVALPVDGSEVALGVSQYLFLGPGSLRLAFRAGERGGGRIAEASLREVRAEAAVPLAPRWSLLLLGSRGEERYTHPESGLRRPLGAARRDVLWRASAVALWQARDRWQWTLRLGWSQRDSNVVLTPLTPDLLDYRRTVVSAGFNWFF